MLEDLYNYSDLLDGQQIVDNAGHDIEKAIQAGSGTGRDYTDQLTSGESLKVESLEPALKILTSKEQHIVLYKMMPKQKAYNTVEEYLQLVDYGLDVGIFNSEGETPQFNDSIYRRKAALIKFSGIAGEVTHPAQLVNVGGGIGNMLSQEVMNKTQYLMRAINKSLSTANSGMVSHEFDGIFKQHYDALGTSLNSYFGSSLVINANGKALADGNVEDAVNSIVNDNFGMVSDIIAAPIVFNDYVKRFHESKRVLVNNPIEATTGATMGQRVNTIATQFGNINIQSDIFFDYKKPVAYNAAATSAKAPVTPTVDAVTPIAAVTDSSNEFGTTWAGSYWYGVRSKNRHGESAMALFATAAEAVAATESVDLKWSITDGSYASESFVIYRTEKTATSYLTANFYPIMTINKAELTAGYDGAAAGLARDRNRILPNTTSAIVVDNSEEIWAIKQLAPLMRMDLARTSPSYRFMILAYLTPVLFQAKKIARIYNIGRDIS